METKVINYINNKITNNHLRNFLSKLILSSKINEKLLCLCILIELKDCLLCEDNFSNIIDDIKSTNLDVDYETFTDYVSIVFAEEYATPCKYSRVVSLTDFETYIGSYDHSSLEIDEEKIRNNGWSSGNGVVWITPYHDIINVIHSSKQKTYSADDVCDHVGFARTKELENTKSLQKTNLEFVVIHYSEQFNDIVYQPNSLNANWKNINTLFISYPKLDGFGRTYNENQIVFAKEQVHETSFYYDDSFEAFNIGKMSVDLLFTRSGILQEAFNRLNI